MNRSKQQVHMPERKNLKKYFLKGIDFSTYLKEMEEKVRNKNAGKISHTKLKITELNFHRIMRILRNYQISEDLQRLLQTFSSTQYWLVLSEHWCGDSAQTLPYIVKIAESHPLIQLKLLYRDQNPMLIDLYLTNNTRSIPKLIAFSESGDELFLWGPRPKEAADLFYREKEAGLKKDEILNKLHLWYGRNRGKAIEKEFLAILSNMQI